ncbi:TIGR02444 family protein [Shewanella profunda]|uniref:TIGR02444 family protein n=1 Tax=Shewanella profunda TaxID=254793 RepID=UPI00200F7371|nr:TIGR02444 family protein [Shewanella profunda]MCL1089938.1 TIGR02444 family protein [Shewanella profunda]
MQNPPRLDSQIWDWCYMSYGHNKALCLELQDSCQVNVNLLLLAQYLDMALDATGSRQYSTEQWQTLAAAVGEWDEKFLSPYRRLRRLAKASLNKDEYKQMLDVELMMERKAQRAITRTLKGLTPNGLRTNLVSYLSLFGLGEADVKQLDLLTP